MIDKLLSIIPFDSIRKWLSAHPDVALILFLCVCILAFLGGLYIA